MRHMRRMCHMCVQLVHAYCVACECRACEVRSMRIPQEDRSKVSQSHGKGFGRREEDEMLHLQLLDLALLSQVEQ